MSSDLLTGICHIGFPTADGCRVVLVSSSNHIRGLTVVEYTLSAGIHSLCDVRDHQSPVIHHVL